MHWFTTLESVPTPCMVFIRSDKSLCTRSRDRFRELKSSIIPGPLTDSMAVPFAGTHSSDVERQMVFASAKARTSYGRNKSTLRTSGEIAHLLQAGLSRMAAFPVPCVVPGRQCAWPCIPYQPTSSAHYAMRGVAFTYDSRVGSWRSAVNGSAAWSNTFRTLHDYFTPAGKNAVRGPGRYP